MSNETSLHNTEIIWYDIYVSLSVAKAGPLTSIASERFMISDLLGEVMSDNRDFL